MTATVEVLSAGPLVTVQDRGRPGHLNLGLARGGAADRRALDEAAALLGAEGAVFEVQGNPLRLRATAPTSVALTGAPMRATGGGRPWRWHAAQVLEAGEVLDLRPGGAGYSCVQVGAGLGTEVVMGSRAAHVIAGIGRLVAAGDALPFTPHVAPERALRDLPDRFAGGTLRCVPGPQTRLFAPEEVARFQATRFLRDPRGNRQGVRLAFDGAGFAAGGQLGLLSDFILPGDIQMTGDGVPYILGPECQTTGGYPRIATVIAADLPRAMQAAPGAALRFRMVTVEEARAARPGPVALAPLVRDPREVPDLLAKQLVGGVISARDPEGGR